MTGPSYPPPGSAPDPYQPGQGSYQPGPNPYPSGQNPYPSGQSPYPAADPYRNTYPGGPQDQLGPTRTPEPPGSVKAAFLTYLVTALISLVSVVVVLTSNVYDKAIIDAANSGEALPDGVTAEQLVSIAKTISIVVGVLFLALYLLFAFKMRSGRNWARIVLTVLSALSVLSVASTGSVRVANRTYSSSMSLISGWVGAALAILAIVFMYVAASNQYFREAADARKRR